MIDLKAHVAQTKTMLKLSTIPRWSIVEMHKRQSVGEHSFNTWILATSLYDYMFITPHNSYARESLAVWALTHDMDEVFMGDIPSPAKEIYSRLSPGINVLAKDEALKNTLPEIVSRARGLKDSLPYYLVKLADAVEALIFATIYTIRESDKQEVFEYIVPKTRETYTYAVQKNQALDWDRAREWLNSMVPGLIL